MKEYTVKEDLILEMINFIEWTEHELRGAWDFNEDVKELKENEKDNKLYHKLLKMINAN